MMKTCMICSIALIVLIFSFCTTNARATDIISPSSVTTTIDVHAHAWIYDGSASAQQLSDLMTANGISKVIMMQPPMANYHDTEISPDNSDNLRNFFLSRGNSFLYMYGGSELQPLLYATGHAGTITLAELYPNGGADMSQADVDKLNAIAADTTKTYTNIFKARATAAAQSGKYIGFGELAPLHYSGRSGQPYMIYKVDTPGMLWLSDLAAQYNMVLDIHLEATSTTLAEFATLLAYNTKTKIIWDHAGWSNTQLATAAVFSQMLADHPNLYLSLKMRSNSTQGAGSPTDSNGNLKSEWRTLLTTYADRIMVATDAKYWQVSGTTIETELAGTYTLLDNMLKLLPADTAQKIRNDTAKALFDPVVCSFPLSPGGYSFSSSPGTGSITVTPSSNSCSWTAISNDSWITITSGSSGTGNGSINYSVAVNSDASARTGVIILADQIFTIAQAGSNEGVFLISLANGWNLISLPLQPGNTATANILKDISLNFSIVWGDFNPSTQQWKYKNSSSGGLLNNMNPTKGYWIYNNTTENISWEIP